MVSNSSLPQGPLTVRARPATQPRRARLKADAVDCSLRWAARYRTSDVPPYRCVPGCESQHRLGRGHGRRSALSVTLTLSYQAETCQALSLPGRYRPSASCSCSLVMVDRPLMLRFFASL
jgi:hypothetical protein